MLSQLRRWFFAGLLVTTPILMTLFVLAFIINLVDSQVAQFMPEAVRRYMSLPGLGLIISILTIIGVGALTSGFLGKNLIKIGDMMMNAVPVVRTVYGATKQIMETVMATQSDAFREVVLLEYPRKGVWVIGFVTGATKGEVQNISQEDLINVFIPTTPNPTSGFLLFLDRRDVRKLDMTVEEAVKMVVSGGIVTPSDPRLNRSKASFGGGKSASGADVSSRPAPELKTISAVIEHALRGGKSNEEALRDVKRAFPKAKTAMATVSGLRSKLRKSGAPIPSQYEARAKDGGGQKTPTLRASKPMAQVKEKSFKTIGLTVEHYIRQGRSNDEVLRVVKQAFPKAKTAMATVSGIRSRLRKSDKSIPSQYEARGTTKKTTKPKAKKATAKKAGKKRAGKKKSAKKKSRR